MRKIQVEIVGDASRLGKAFKQGRHDAVLFGNAIEHAGRRAQIAMGAIGAAAIGGVIKGTKAFNEYERSMTQIVSLTGVAEKQTKAWSDQLLKLGPQLGKGPKELAESLYFVTSAGLRGQRAIEALTMSAKASKAGLGETAVIADAVTSAMNAYAKTGLTAAKATDVLTASVVEGKFEASTLAPVLGNLLPTASALGISFDKVAGTLAVLSKTGTDASEGSTQLNAMMMAMLSTSPKVVKGLASVGLTQKKLRDEAAGPRGLVGVMRLLEKSFGGNVEAMRQVIPNVRAFRPIMNALAQSGEDVDRVLNKVTNSAGLTAKAFARAQQDAGFKWDKARASMESAFIRIGGLAAPAVDKLAAGLDVGVEAFNSFLEKLGKARTTTAKLNVIWKGAESVATGLQKMLGTAIGKIDWNAVWAKGQGIATGLQQRIETLDWNMVGKKLGDSFRKAAEKAFSNTKILAGRIAETVRKIRWEELGKSMGPGLASAVTVAFLTLLDPAFWIRNWDLAISIAIVAFTGPIGRIGSKLALMFKGVGGRLAIALGVGLMEKLPRVGGVVVNFFEKQLPRSLAKAGQIFGRVFDFMFGGLADRITKFLAKHGVIKFALKVLGVDLLINSIKNPIEQLAGWLKRQGVRAVLAYIEPYSHIPKWGGAWARKLKKELAGVDTEEPAVGPPKKTGPGSRYSPQLAATTGAVNVGMVALAKEQAAKEAAAKRGARGGGGGAGGTDGPDEAARKRREKDSAAEKKRQQEKEKKAAEAILAAAEKAKETWKAALASARSGVGSLFGGPTLGPMSSAIGTRGVTVDPLLILQDIRQQNADAKSLFKDLGTIKQRGGKSIAGSGFLDQLRALGPDGANLVASIARAPKDVFNAIVASFKARQSLIRAEAIYISAGKVMLTDKGAVPTHTGPGGIVHRRSGGTVPGSGHGDTVPAMLTPGELVLNRRQQKGLAGVLGMHGASPDMLFGAIQHFAGGGPVQSLSRWFSKHKPEANMISRLGNWIAGSPVGQLAKYGNKQAGLYVSNLVGGFTPDGMRSMAEFFGTMALAYHPDPRFHGKGAKGRADAQLSAMGSMYIEMLRNPIANAGALAAMITPLPGPGKLSGSTRALERLKLKLGKQGYMPPEHGIQGPNLRLERETGGVGGDVMLGAAKARRFNRTAAMLTARGIFADIRAQKLNPRDVLPVGVNSPADLVELMQDLHTAARAGNVGRFWYERSGAAIKTMTGGNIEHASRIAKLAAMYSPQVSAEESIKRALVAYREFNDKKPIGSTGHGANFKWQPDAAHAILSGKDVKLGRKSSNFYMDLMRGVDPDWVERQIRSGVGFKGGRKGQVLSGFSSTQDVWMQRAFGYQPRLVTGGKKAGAFKVPGPTGAQYDFMDAVTASVAAQLGWDPHQAQAAIWTTTKSRFEGRPPNQAAWDFSDYFRRTGTKINYEAAWGNLGEDIKRRLGMRAAQTYLRQKMPLVRGVSERLGLLGTSAGKQQGVWGVDVSPGAGELVLAPRIKESSGRFQLDAPHAMRVREAAAAIGYILRQDAVGTMTGWDMITSAGTKNAKVAAGANSVFLARRLSDKQLARVSSALGESMLMLPHQGGWIIKPASTNSARAGNLLPLVQSKLAGMRGMPELQAANVRTGLITADQYDALIARADKHNPGFRAWVEEQRKLGSKIDSSWEQRLAVQTRKRGHAAGGVIGGHGSSDTVPAMLTPGELVLNRRQQRGLARVLGLGNASPARLFGEVAQFQHGGVVSGRRQSRTFVAGSGTAAQAGSTFQQHNTIMVPAHFSDTAWAVERGLERASWRLRKGI